MAVLLVTTDRDKKDPEPDPVMNVVDKYDHVELAQGEFAIVTDEKTRTVFNKILPFLKKNVHPFVITLARPFASSALGPIGEWLRKHLPEH